MANREVQQSVVSQPETIIDEEVDKIVDDLTLLWLFSPTTDLPMPQTLHVEEIEDLRYIA